MLYTIKSHEKEKITIILKSPQTQVYKQIHKSRVLCGDPEAIFDTNEPKLTSINDQVNDQDAQVDDQGEKNTLLTEKHLNEQQIKVLEYCVREKSSKDIQEVALQLVPHTYNFKRYIKPLLEKGLLVRTLPEKPTSQNQKYIITNTGKKILSMISKQND